ncbi:hypothetical protein [Deinococcus roseus]|uniref:TubC N-terminal docking domain-containing protein n=1 Tax=Deinococcus roseus TaxID=392414 RepID=A0ABQ2D3J8_9DEIO|nr:hypothetical protein [Deinococcus roseus]GGJ40426.1 hypothetical protein GCM10008938_28150 [Deinococcus roseus]
MTLEEYLKKHNYTIEIIDAGKNQGYIVHFREKREDRPDLIHNDVPTQPQSTPELALQQLREHIEGMHQDSRSLSTPPMVWTYAHGKKAVGWALESGHYEYFARNQEEAEIYSDLIARAARDLSLLVKSHFNREKSRIEMELRGIGKMSASTVVVDFEPASAEGLYLVD